MFIFSNARCISSIGSVDIWTFVPPAAWNPGPRGCGSIVGGTYDVRGLPIVVRDEEKVETEEVEDQILRC